MIGMRTILQVADNSGARRLACILPRGGDLGLRAGLGDIVCRYPKIFVPEINLGQLSRLIRAEFLVDARSYGKLYGVPFQAADLEQQILKMIEEN